MCIIIAKLEHADFPSKSTLKTYFENNPDGAGFMFADGIDVIYKKGYMTFTRFYKDLREMRELYGDDIPYILHFRISTQGGIRPELTHPFPISDSMLDLAKLSGVCKVALAHNGIISQCSSEWGSKVTYNDTMKFVTDYASLIIKNQTYYKDSNKVTLLRRIADSRLAILSANKHVEIIGDGWIKDEGILYSNSSYYPKIYRYY